MRNLGRGVIVGVVLATACGGGAKNADTTSTAAPPAGQPAAGSSAAAPAAGAPAAGSATAMAATTNGTAKHTSFLIILLK